MIILGEQEEAENIPAYTKVTALLKKDPYGGKHYVVYGTLEHQPRPDSNYRDHYITDCFFAENLSSPIEAYAERIRICYRPDSEELLFPGIPANIEKQIDQVMKNMEAAAEME